MNTDDLIGKRIQYRKTDTRKSGCRNGWTGTIKSVRRDNSVPGCHMIEIQYDNGVLQPYCIEALEGYGVPRMHPDVAGYLHFIGGPGKITECGEALDIPEPTHFVRGDGGTWQFFNELDAHEFAKDKAKKSNYNRAFIVLKVQSKYQRAEPPVERIDF